MNHTLFELGHPSTCRQYRIPAVSMLLLIAALFLLAACSPSPASLPTAVLSPTGIPPTSTPRLRILPTWTPSPTLLVQPSLTPRPTITPRFAPIETVSSIPGAFTSALLLDRPSSALLDQPASLVSLHYDPSVWSLVTSYPTTHMGYALVHRTIYQCSLEPSVGRATEGFQVERYSRALSSTTYEITRVSQAGVLEFASYCTGEGEDHTCYQLNPGDNHEACQIAGEAVLSSFALLPNPFIAPVIDSPNNWLCQDPSGQSGLCTVSYSVPLNALAFTNVGGGWAAGDDGLLFQLSGQIWSEFTSPYSQPIYDLSFSSSNEGWAVGKGAQVLRWDGTAWTEVLPYHAPGEGPGGSTQILYAVDGASADDAWMVGSMKGLDGKNQPYAIHWNGIDLVEVNSFPECICGLNAVLILGEDDVIALGGSALGAIAFRWDGATWTSNLVPGADALYALARGADGTVWAAGIESSRDRSEARGTLFRLDGTGWHRLPLPPLVGGVYSLAALPGGQVVLGGDFSALWTGSEWQPIPAGIAGYGWIVDIAIDSAGDVWALTRSGNLFLLELEP